MLRLHPIWFFVFIIILLGLASWLSQPSPEKGIPDSLHFWEEENEFTACGRAMYKLLAVQALRSDR